MTKARKAQLMLTIVLLAFGLLGVYLRFFYGLPFLDFGSVASINAVRIVEHDREKPVASDQNENSSDIIVATHRFALSARTDIVGIHISSYRLTSTGWKFWRDSTADACQLESFGVPNRDAEFLSTHMYRAVITIPYQADCALSDTP